MGELVSVSRRDRVAEVALNRPQKRNALSVALCRDLVDALEAAGADPGTGAVLLTANGPAFCAGMDLAEILDTDTGSADAAHERLFTIGSRIPIPIVAAVRGAALAGGTGVVANCHIVVAAEDARFGLTEIRLGLWPFVIFRQVALAVGERRAVELGLTGRIFEAREARDYGLVHDVVPAGQVETRAREIAAAVAEFSPAAMRAGLAFVRDIRGKPWEEAGAEARKARAEIFRTEEFRAGVRRFLEKRHI